MSVACHLQIYSQMFKSRLWLGHPRAFGDLSQGHYSHVLAVIWVERLNFHSNSSKTSLYLALFILPSIFLSQTHSMMLPTLVQPVSQKWHLHRSVFPVTILPSRSDWWISEAVLEHNWIFSHLPDQGPSSPRTVRALLAGWLHSSSLSQ